MRLAIFGCLLVLFSPALLPAQDPVPPEASPSPPGQEAGAPGAPSPEQEGPAKPAPDEEDEEEKKPRRVHWDEGLWVEAEERLLDPPPATDSPRLSRTS